MERDLVAGKINPRDLKARLAGEIITRLRGAAAAVEAEEHFERVFRRHELGAADLTPLTLEPGDDEAGTVYLPKLLERWFGLSRSEARRRLEQGGVTLDGEAVTDLSVSTAFLAGKRVKAGKSTTFQGVVVRR
jgi:tyrosyl-tRNA synthetase